MNIFGIKEIIRIHNRVKKRNKPSIDEEDIYDPSLLAGQDKEVEQDMTGKGLFIDVEV